MGGPCRATSCHEQTTRLHMLSCSKTGWGIRPTVRCSTARWPKPLHKGVPVANSELFQGHEHRNGKNLLSDLPVVVPYTPTNFGTEAKRLGFAITATVERSINEYWSTFPTIYSLLPLGLSTCGALCSDTEALIEAMMIRSVDLQHYVTTDRARAAPEC